MSGIEIFDTLGGAYNVWFLTIGDMVSNESRFSAIAEKKTEHILLARCFA